MIHTVYDKRTGRILGHIANAETSGLASGEGLVKGHVDPREFFIRGRKPVPLADMPLEVDGGRVTGIPKGATVYSAGRQERVSGSWSGSGLVTIECPGYRTVHLTLTTYRESRAAAYPPLGDQLDAIAKGIAAIRTAGLALPDETCAWLDAVTAVKAAHPKD